MKKLIHEIHRRSLWQVLGLYLAGSWVVLQVVDQLVQSAGLPDWVPALALVLLLIGFPMVLATAFVQEGMPGQGDDDAEAASVADPAESSEPVHVAPTPAPRPKSAASQSWLGQNVFTWRNAIAGGVAALALFGAATAVWMVLRGAGVGSAGTLVAKGLIEDDERVVLADFSGDSTLAVAATMALRVQLAESGVVSVAEPSLVKQALRRMEVEGGTLDAQRAREVAEREGLNAVVAGDVAGAGGSFILTVHVIETATGDELVTVGETAADSADFLDAMDRLSRKLRERMGESLGSIRASAPLERATTSSTEALRKYSRSREAFDARDMEKTITLLDEAIALDSAFGMAWRGLAIADEDRREEAATKAYELRDRLTERERYHAIGIYQAYVLEDYDETVTTYRALLESYPDDATALNNLGVAYRDLGQNELAAEMYGRAVEVDPSSAHFYANLIPLLYDLGQVDSSRAVLTQFAERFPGHPNVIRYQSSFAYVDGDLARAEAILEPMLTSEIMSPSRFAERARWRRADCLWDLGKVDEAREVYRGLLRSKPSRSIDPALARFRLAEAAAREGRKDAAVSALRSFRSLHPGHPLEERAIERLRELGGPGALSLTHGQRINRTVIMTRDKRWRRSIAELRKIPDDAPADVLLRRDFWTGMTLFKMRRRYKDAGEILLRIYKKMGSRAAEAMFHGARALSRADLDEQAIDWYQKVVAEYPRSKWAAEAQYLSGWLWFNMGEYAKGIPYLEQMRVKYRRSKWTKVADWYLGFSYFLLDQRAKALPYFERLAKRGGKLKGGQGRYWAARTKWLLGRKKEANAEYRKLVSDYPFSWYAMLSRARLARQGIEVSPFGDRGIGKLPTIARNAPPEMRADPALLDARELIAAGLTAEAGLELRRAEKGFLNRHKRKRAQAYAALMDIYREAGNYNRPWMLAATRGSRALNAPPKGNARIWWEHAYPRAFETFVKKHASVGNTPPLYLWSIMRKESGFDPGVRSYANAMGLLQMIPPTAKRVAKALGVDYTGDLLFDPELNIKTGSWYIGRLLAKFKGQIPYAAGAYNGGPRAIMRWMRKFKGQPADIWGELASYAQTRGYMKKVTESYARYVYLYENKVYDLPLAIDFDYVENDLTY